MALTDTKVRSAKPEEKEYSLVDGDGMSLLVKPNGSKYWRFRFRFGGKQHLMAFGVYPEILANARQKKKARKLVAAGIDPREHKRAVKEEQAKEIITFEKVAREWLATNQKWSEDHANRVKRAWRTISSRQLVLATLLNWVLVIYWHPLKQWNCLDVLRWLLVSNSAPRPSCVMQCKAG
jgi:hypothetical protein